MKNKYVFIIILLVIITVGFEILLFSSPLGEHPRIEKMIQGLGVFIALLTAIIALAVADQRRNKVEITIATPSISVKEEYLKSEMSEKLLRKYDDFNDPVESYRVQFCMTNNSNFSLTKPTFTFWLPIEKQHPKETKTENGYKVGKQSKYSTSGFHSNIYNSLKELSIFEFADMQLLSNSIMPYWNNKESITFWTRMSLNSKQLQPFILKISVNCENADGITIPVTVKPKELLKNGSITN